MKIHIQIFIFDKYLQQHSVIVRMQKYFGEKSVFAFALECKKVYNENP